jgi:ubiquinone/menaquinone biosynthesis C-methylase UbiE
MAQKLEWKDEECKEYIEDFSKTTRLIYRPWAKTIFEISKNKFVKPVIADIACGPGFLSFELAKLIPDGEFLLLDNAEEMLTFAQKQLKKNNLAGQTINCKTNSLKLADQSVDIAVYRYLLPFIEDTATSFQEVYRTLKPGGFFFIIEVNPEAPRLKTLFVSAFTRIMFGKSRKDNFWFNYNTNPKIDELENKLRDTGFTGIASKTHMADYLVYAQKGFQ